MLRHHIKLLFLNMTHAQRKILIQERSAIFFYRARFCENNYYLFYTFFLILTIWWSDNTLQWTTICVSVYSVSELLGNHHKMVSIIT